MNTHSFESWCGAFHVRPADHPDLVREFGHLRDQVVVIYAATKTMGERDIPVTHDTAERAQSIARQLNGLYGSSLEEALVLRFAFSCDMAEAIADDVGTSPALREKMFAGIEEETA